MEKIEDLKQDELENKKHYFYAEINENNICHSLLSTPKITEAENMIEVDSYDMSLIGKKYENGIWKEQNRVLKKFRIQSLFRQKCF